MSADATAEMALEHEQPQIDVAHESPPDPLKPTGLHSPPDSNNAMKLDGSDDSELSDIEDPDLSADADFRSTTRPTSHDEPEQQTGPEPEKEDEDEDIGEILPAEWSGTVPVFRPTMHQFKDFKKFMEKIDSYGMKSGIVKVIPPQEWRDKLPALDEMVKQIKVREPIKQDIMGSNGTYRQVNILHQRSYNLPQWRLLCDQSEHQPPARRGERRAHHEKPKRPPQPRISSATSSRRDGRRGKQKKGAVKDATADEEDRPMTPVSPKPADKILESVENDPGAALDEDDDDTPVIRRMGGSRQAKPKTQSTSARRKYSRREASAKIDEEAFKDWDYHMDISDYTPERCEELERIYWKTLTYAPPLYGADLLGTLFTDETETWNLNKLPNLLDVLGTKVPGVNTAYLYLGMWKATFAWHLEDVDLYSINYLHFGAPKQWYSISQGDARRFEAAMKSIWPTDAKACDQFLRHKAFLISPNHLKQYFNIQVNKCISYPGEFVVTYPYGYHSGYNLGYNCAEAVNFALDSWLPMGKIAKRCECAQAQDSVWVDVYEIERKLRGEETDYEETDDEEDEDEEEEEDDIGLHTPESSHVKIKQLRRKRKRRVNDQGERKPKKLRLRVRLKAQVEPPCCLCPNNILDAELLPTNDGRKAHRMCALYVPETWIETVDGQETVANVENISKARLDLKCLYCRSKRGACFQCSQRKCARSYHATCAAAAGVFIEEGEVPIFGEDGTEYKEQAFEFSCRFHRTKRDKKLDGDALDACQKTREAAAALKKGDIAQLQYYRGDIFAGVVVENRHEEQTLLVEIIPNGCEAFWIYSNTEPRKLTLISDRVEVEWKWLLLPDPADFHLPKASPNAIPMPTSRKAKDEINATKRTRDELPRKDDTFVEGFTWAEFHTNECTNKEQTKVDLSKENQLWYYLGKTSTEARAQYTEDPRRRYHNPKSNFMDTIPRPPPPRAMVGRPYAPAYRLPTTGAGINSKFDKPYQYKPKTPLPPSQSFQPLPYTTQQFVPNGLAARPFPTSTSVFAPQTSAANRPTGSMPPPLSSKPSAYPPSSVPKPHVHKAAPRQTSHHQHHRKQPLPFGTDAHLRSSSSSTYASARFESSSSSPFRLGFSQPPGLGTSPSPENQQLFQAQARARSSSSAASFTTPMTSSAIRPPPAESGTGDSLDVKLPPIMRSPPPNAVQKYPYFQIHHNRDSTRYRTPYAPWGGFTNGYEGNLRAHQMGSPDAFFDAHGRQSLLRHSPSDRKGAGGLLNSSPYSPPVNGSKPASSTAKSQSTSDMHGSQRIPQQSQPSPPALSGPQQSSQTWDDKMLAARAAQLHPAIRAQWAALLQRKKMENQARDLQAEMSKSRGQQLSIPELQRPGEQQSQQQRVQQIQPSQSSPGTGTQNQQNPSSSRSVDRRGSISNSISADDPRSEALAQYQAPQSTVGQSPSGALTTQSQQQSFVPPPRPQEQAQSPQSLHPQGHTAQQIPAMSLSNITNQEPRPVRPYSEQGLQPSNVSGSFWQKLPQTMPNSSSLGNQ